jgi:trk system potassium uptake protein
MFVLIVGGGKVGRYLINDFLNKGYEIVLIEQDKDKCDKIKNKYDIKIIWGDGSEKEILEKAGIEKADAVLAVTEDDQDNLVICQLAERQYSIPRTFTRVNTPGNEKLFNWLGVNVAVSSASILSALLTQEMSIRDLEQLLKKDQDRLKLIKIGVRKGSFVIDRKIKDIDLPLESVLVTIIRGDKPIVPRGNTIILEGDLVLALTKPEFENDLLRTFND